MSLIFRFTAVLNFLITTNKRVCCSKCDFYFLLFSKSRQIYILTEEQLSPEKRAQISDDSHEGGV